MLIPVRSGEMEGPNSEKLHIIYCLLSQISLDSIHIEDGTGKLHQDAIATLHRDLSSIACFASVLRASNGAANELSDASGALLSRAETPRY